MYNRNSSESARGTSIRAKLISPLQNAAVPSTVSDLDVDPSCETTTAAIDPVRLAIDSVDTTQRLRY